MAKCKICGTDKLESFMTVCYGCQEEEWEESDKPNTYWIQENKEESDVN